MAEPTWIREDVVLAVHRRLLAEHGGPAGVRDPGLLASALARPRHAYHYSQPRPDLPALAAAYAFGIARNHPFADGNKRTAYVVCRAFLRLNGADIDAPRDEKYQTVVTLAEGRLTEDDLASWLRDHLVDLV